MTDNHNEVPPHSTTDHKVGEVYKPSAVQRLLEKSGMLIMIGVIGCLVLATALLLMAGAGISSLVWALMNSTLEGGKKVAVVTAIEQVDLVLLGTVFYMIALGLYELFIDDRLDLPDWLEFHSMDDLKHKLAGVMVVVMAVLFLGQVVSWDGERDLLKYGISIAAVVASLRYYLGDKH